jgi:hypothetical protein
MNPINKWLMVIFQTFNHLMATEKLYVVCQKESYPVWIIPDKSHKPLQVDVSKHIHSFSGLDKRAHIK